MKLTLQFKKRSLFVLLAMMIYSQLYPQSYCGSNPVDIHGKLSVSGNKIVDENTQPVSFAGNSMFWSNTGWGAERFYNNNVVSWLKEDWGATIVRAAMGVEDNGGYLSDSSNKDRVKAVVDAAIAEGMYVIIDWHSHGAENYESQAVEFFKEMASLYGNHPNVIYEIYNEPVYTSWSTIKSYAETVISAIRAIDPDNLIIVGTPTWSQDVDIASNNPITSSTNIAYTLHFYAGTHFANLRAKAQTALNNGIALMVTEWGTVNANGDGGVNTSSTNEWMNFLSQNHISHLNWSVHDKAEGASILNSGASSTGGWSDSNLTASGSFVKNIIENWDQYCDGEPIVTPPTVENSLMVSSLNDFSANGGTQTITISSNIDWTVSENSSWISLNSTSGSNDGTLTINVSENFENIGRSADIIFSGGGITRTVSVSQDAAFTSVVENSLTVSSLNAFSANGGTQTITVSSNVSWSVNENSSWVSLNNTNGSNNGSVTVSVLGNSANAPRSAIITVSGGGITRTMSVSQDAAEDNSLPTTNYIQIPSLIEAEDYVSQLGTQSENSQDLDNGTSIGWIDQGNYLTYNVNVPNSDTYLMEFRVASRVAGTNFDIYQGNTVVGNISSSATGGWYNWETVSTNVSLTEGEQTIKILATGNGWNINWIKFSEGDDTVTTPPTTEGCNGIAEWDPTIIYADAGTQVVFEGTIYENKWYTLNQSPANFSANPWDLWTVIGSCSSNKTIEIDPNIGFNVYPNPFNNTLSFSANNTIQEIESIQVVDLSGKVITKGSFNNNLNNLSHLSKGLYLIQALNAKGQIIAVKKAVKE